MLEQAPSRWIPILFVAAALIARLTLLLSRPFWHDELFTIWAARLPPTRLLEALRHDSGPPLFYLLERPLVLLGETARSDRLSRLIPFVAMLLLFAAASRLRRAEGRGWFLVLAACSPLMLVYTTEARAYALVALLALTLFLLLFRGEPTPVRLASAAAIAALSLWTHYLAIFLVTACALLLLARRRLLPLAALSFGALLFLPWIPVLAAQPKEATAWMREPLGASLLGFLSALGGSGRIPNPLGGPLPHSLAMIGAATGAALVLVFAFTAGTKRDREASDAVILTVLTMGLVVAASLARPVAFSGRSEMVILPIWLWAISRGTAAGGWARGLAAAAVATSAVSSLFLIAVAKPEPVASRAVALAVQLAGKQDRVVAGVAFYLPALLARDRGRLAAPLTAFPPDLADHPGWIAARPPAESDYRSIETALDRLERGAHGFLLIHPILHTPRLDRVLALCGDVRAAVDQPEAQLLVCTAR